MSILKVAAIQNAAGVEVYTAKAWVNFNGTGTLAIRAAGNVSSVTDNGTGDYTANFTNAMTDANFCVSASCTRSIDNLIVGVVSTTSSAVRVQVKIAGAALTDSDLTGISVFR